MEAMGMERSRAELKTLAATILRGASPEEAVTLSWPLVCGSRIAQSTKAISFSDGVLRVAVPDAAWRTELAGYMPQYLYQLTQLTGVAVEKIQFSVTHR